MVTTSEVIAATSILVSAMVALRSQVQQRAIDSRNRDVKALEEERKRSLERRDAEHAARDRRLDEQRREIVALERRMLEKVEHITNRISDSEKLSAVLTERVEHAISLLVSVKSSLENLGCRNSCNTRQS